MTELFVGHFDACLGCMACVTACPSGVEYGPLIEDTRAQIERRFQRSPGDRLFRNALFMPVPYPWRMRLALRRPLAIGGSSRGFTDRPARLAAGSRGRAGHARAAGDDSWADRPDPRADASAA